MDNEDEFVNPLDTDKLKKMFDDIFTGLPKPEQMQPVLREPSAAARQVARLFVDQYGAFISEGLDPYAAFEMTSRIFLQHMGIRQTHNLHKEDE